MSDSGCFIIKSELRLLKFKALRSGVWFKALNRLDRALIDLTIRVADRVRSSKLANALAKAVEKLRSMLEDRFLNAVFKVGLPLARKYGLLASSWGNPYAVNWISDLSYARFLAVIYVNNSPKNMETSPNPRFNV